MGMRNIVKSIFLIYFVIFLMIAVVSKQPIGIGTKTQAEQLYCYESDTWYWGNSEKFCVKDGYIYLLYEDSDILVVYDTDGVYQKSYAFRGKSKGLPEIRMDQDYVYLFDQSHNCYTFSGDEWIGYRELDSDAYFAMIRGCVRGSAQREDENGAYFMRWMSIYRTAPDSTENRIVARPFFLKFVQGGLPFIGMAFCWVGLVAIMLYLKHKDML